MKFNERAIWAIVLSVLLMVSLVVAGVTAQTPTPDDFASNIFFTDGGNLMIVASGGEIEVQSGGVLDVDGTFAGTNLEASGYIKAGVATPVAITTPAAGDLIVSDDLEVMDDTTLSDDVKIGGDITLENSEKIINSTDAQISFTDGTNILMTIADGGTTGNLSVTGTAGVTGMTTHTGGETILTNVENIMQPTWISVPITWTAAAGGSGVVATIGTNEIWIVHSVLVNVTTNFDCTGDDATLVIGDGNDADGFIVLADAELQAADTEGTGFEAGWQGMTEATIGVYLDPDGTDAAPINGFVYQSTETIDWLLDEGSGETITAGAATIYVCYTRIL